MFKNPKHNPALFYGALILVCFLGFIILVNLIVHLGASSRIYKNTKDVKVAQTALVLGAAVYSDGELSPVYKERVDKAFELYNDKKVSKILASGDNSTVEHNEVNPVRNYLLTKGVPDGDIFLDHAGFDTYSTMYRARDIFKVSSVIIVTQSFHLPRAVFIARALGIDAYGVPADDENVKTSNYVREIFANEKAVWNIVFHREPKYLGKEIPIDEEKETSKPTPVPTPNPDDRVAAGYIAGHVNIGPNCPVEIEGKPCPPSPEAYSSRVVMVYERDGVTVNEKGKIDLNGNFNIAVGPGNYFVQIKPAGIGEGEKKPVTVKSFETSTVNFDIDTGIR